MCAVCYCFVTKCVNQKERDVPKQYERYYNNSCHLLTDHSVLGTLHFTHFILFNLLNKLVKQYYYYCHFT